DAGRGNAGAHGGAAGCGAGGGDVGISAVVDVEHGALRAFEEDGLAFIEGVVDEFGGIADVRTDFFAELQGLVDFVREVDIGTIGALREAILFRDYASGFFTEERGIEEITGAQAATSHLVFVGRADTARSRADFVGTTRRFGGLVEFAMVRKDEMGTIADVQAALDIDANLGEHFDFVDKRGGVNDHARTNDGVLLGTQDATRDELKDVLFFADDDGVAGIVASG